MDYSLIWGSVSPEYPKMDRVSEFSVPALMNFPLLSNWPPSIFPATSNF